MRLLLSDDWLDGVVDVFCDLRGGHSSSSMLACCQSCFWHKYTASVPSTGARCRVVIVGLPHPAFSMTSSTYCGCNLRTGQPKLHVLGAPQVARQREEVDTNTNNIYSTCTSQPCTPHTLPFPASPQVLIQVHSISFDLMFALHFGPLQTPIVLCWQKITKPQFLIPPCFNLLPTTLSLHILEKHPARNANTILSRLGRVNCA